MSIYKRIAGNLVIETVGATDTVTFQGLTANAATVIIDGNLSVSGNATLTGNISGDNIFNGTTSIAIPVASGNANITIGGTSNITVFATTGQYVTGLMSASGNIIGANVNTGGLISATGNITGGNLNTPANIFLNQTSTGASDQVIRFADANTATSAGGNIGAVQWYTSDATGAGPRVTAAIRAVYSDSSGNANIGIFSNAGSDTARVTILGATGNVGIANTAPAHTFAVTGNGYVSGTFTAVGNVTAGNIATAGLISAAGNITIGNVATGGLISATGNITGGNVISLGAVSAGAGGISASGNVTGGNVNSLGILSVTSNIIGGNVVSATTLSASANIVAGATITAANANITANMFGTGIGVENIVWQSTANTVSSATMANIGVLSFNALANYAYKFNAYLPVLPDGSTTTAFSVLFSAGTCRYTLETQAAPTTAWAVATSETSDTTGTTQSMTGTTARAVRITGTFFHTGNVTLSLRGQTSAANLTIPAGAHLTYTRIG
jgi:filamentous hemagglutinin